jgi:N-acetylglucosamine kinase-like BadF-type ATPase
VPFFLGIDGGGTKTRCIVGNQNSVLGTGSGAGCNLLRVGEACAQDSLASAIQEACVAANVSPKQIARTCAGISGAADNGIASMVQRLMNEIVGGAIEVIGDMEVALEGAFQGGPGVIVIGGTGSIAYGRNSRGEQARAGGWGRVISDEGSGHWIAVRALSAAMRQRDRAEKSDLLNDLMAALEVRTAEDLVVKLNSDPIRDYASLFPVVLASAAGADESALEVLRSAGRELAKLAGLVIERLFSSSDTVSVATHGGVFASSRIVKESFKQEVRMVFANASCVEQDVDPALGALQRARREFGIWHRQ